MDAAWLKDATVQQLADVVNDKTNTSEYRDEAFKILQNNAKQDYINFQLGITTA